MLCAFLSPWWIMHTLKVGASGNYLKKSKSVIPTISADV